MTFIESMKNSQLTAKNEILSGLTVALALVPEAIAFSLIANVSPLVGLYSAFIIGLVTALLGGRPGHDFRGYRRHCRGYRQSGCQAWGGISVCRRRPDGPYPDRYRPAPSR